MTMHCVSVTPHDTAFFRDGRPFNQDDEGLSFAESLFPPSPRTVTACVRTSIAEALDWKGGDWSKNSTITEAVGAGDDLGAVALCGICLHDGQEVFYPAPHCLAATFASDNKIEHLAFLVPDESALVKTDIGNFPLTRLDVPGASVLSGWWISRSGMTELLAGKIPSATALRPTNSLIVPETRVGVARDLYSRQVRNGMLYMADHVRLRDSVRLLVECDLPDRGRFAERRPFGGEGRFAWIEGEEIKWRPRNQTGSKHVLAIALTPISCDPSKLRPDSEFFGTGLTIQSVCMDRPERHGGWSSQRADFGPQRLRNALPAGAAFFLKAEKDADTASLPGQVGMDTKYGYGAMCYGRWREAE